MKYTVTAILTGMLIVATIQPTLAFHYCAGNLRYVEMGEAVAGNCCSMEEGQDYNDGTSYHNPDCCTTYMVELVTDDYQPTSVTVIDAPSQSTVFIHASLAMVQMPVIRQTVSHKTPPKLIAHSANIITLYCCLLN